jgi:polysaccharide export outer membrane protein
MIPRVYGIISKVIVLLLVVGVLDACKSRADRRALWKTSTVVQPASAQYAAQSALAGYRVDSGDRLRIMVFGEASLTGEYAVSPAGMIAMPLISHVPVRGKTTAQVQIEIANRLRRGFLRKPSVAVEIVNYRPFFILGEVRRAGQFPYVSGMNVQSAIAIAGGFSERARQSYVVVTRRTAQGPVKLKLRRNDRIYPGDTIYVKERFL